jgi:rare lipoprotein A (peptidoglycan hydrolase)
MKKYLYLVPVGLVSALIGGFIGYQIFGPKPELISPLSTPEKCLQLNIEVNNNIEKNNNENTKPIPSNSPKPDSASQFHESYKVTASYYTTEYCERYNPSCLTASGEVFTNEGLTAACRSDILLGTKVRITSDQGSVEVRCNDRGNFSKNYGRMFDLTSTAFRQLAPLSKGVVEVTFSIIN